MRKIIINLAFLTAFLSHFYSAAQNPTVSVSPSFCYNTLSPASNTCVATIANPSLGITYAWIVYETTNGSNSGTVQVNDTVGANVTISFPSCGDFNVICLANNGPNTVGTNTVIVDVVCPNWLTVANNGIFNSCVNSSQVLSAGTPSTSNYSAVGYAWTDGVSVLSNSAMVTVSPTVTTNYTVTATQAPNGCPGTATAIVVVGATPTLTATYASSSPSNCAYASMTLSASGANTYTWSASWFSVASATKVLSAVADCYTVTGTSSVGCTSSAVLCTTVQAGPSLTLTSSSPSVCVGGSVTLNATGGVSYTWTAGGPPTVISNSSSAIGVITGTTFFSNTFTVTSTDLSGCETSTYIAVGLSPSPVIGLSYATNNLYNPNIACQSTGVSFAASGATSYTWEPGLFMGANVVFYPLANTCYTVYGDNGGCAGSAVSCITVVPSPTLTVAGTTVACLGSPITLGVSGAGNYTWWSGASTQTQSAFSFTPSAAGSYTWSVGGINNSGCGTTVLGIVTINPLPMITISGNSTVCMGLTNTLSAAGGTSYLWSTGTTVSSITVAPLAATCYSVIGTDANGCNGMGVLCVTPTLATIPMALLTQTACSGSSANFTASGAASYTWNTGAYTSTVNVLAALSSTYSVMGTLSNGCLGANTVTLSIDTTCTNVWPGDANSDGIVDNTDVFEIGFAYSNTGAPRSPGGNAYTSQYATDWTGTVSTGKNKCNADCNGDGTVNNGDTLAIYTNYSLTHAFKSASNSSLSDISLAPDQSYATPGFWSKVNIILGDPSNMVSSLYGVAYEIDFDQSMIETDSAYISYTSSFLTASDQNVNFRKNVFTNGKIYSASVRTNGSDVSGNGKIGEFWFKVKAGAAINSQFMITAGNAKTTNKSGAISTLAPGTTSLTISRITSIKENIALANTIYFFPNPATNQLFLNCGLAIDVSYHLTDVTGREVSRGSFVNSKTLDLSGFANGTYILRFESASEVLYKKLIIEK